MGAKGILPPTLNMILKTRYPLPAQQKPQPVSSQSEMQSCPSPFPCAEPELLGNGQIKTASLEALVDGQEEERWETPLAARSDDMARKHQ